MSQNSHFVFSSTGFSDQGVRVSESSAVIGEVWLKGCLVHCVKANPFVAVLMWWRIRRDLSYTVIQSDAASEARYTQLTVRAQGNLQIF